MNYNESMIKKLITTKKSLPISPYQHFPEFKEQWTKFKEYPHNLLDAFMVNVPGNNKDEPGTIKIMFSNHDFHYFIDLDGNKFTNIPKGWAVISFGLPRIEETLKFRYQYTFPCHVTFFPADKYMQKICSNTGIFNAEKKFSNLLCSRIWKDYHNIEITSERFDITHKRWKNFEKKCQKHYQNVAKLAEYYADRYQETGEPQHCPYLPKYETLAEMTIKRLQERGF